MNFNDYSIIEELLADREPGTGLASQPRRSQEMGGAIVQGQEEERERERERERETGGASSKAKREREAMEPERCACVSVLISWSINSSIHASASA